jgi:hypothetical protein
MHFKSLRAVAGSVLVATGVLATLPLAAAADGPVVAPQPTPLTIDLGQNLIVNGGFEDAISSPWWLGDVPHFNPSVGTVGPDTTQHHCGSRSLRLGRDDATAYYRVAIPATAQRADFSFWMWVDRPGAVWGTQENRLDVEVHQGPAVSHILATYYAHDAAQVTQVWQRKTFDLAAFKGQTIDLDFKNWLGTYYYIDDVALWTGLVLSRMWC